MSVNIYEDKLQHASIFGKDVLCTNWWILRETVPQGWYCYDLKDTISRPGKPMELVDWTSGGHVKTVLSPLQLKRPDTRSRRVEDDFYLHGEELTLAEYCEVHGLECPTDNRRCGREFWHTWHPRGPEELNGPAFKAELTEVVDELRRCGPLERYPRFRENGGCTSNLYRLRKD